MARINLVTGPSVEPVDLATAKAHIGVTWDDDDTRLTTTVTAAREFCERYSGLTFINQTFDLFLDTWDRLPPTNLTAYFGTGSQTGSTIYSDYWRQGLIVFPIGPLVSVTSVQYTDTTGTLETWDTSQYVVSAGLPGRIGVKQNRFFPSIASQVDAVQIRFVAGYGTDATTVPASAKQAILLMVGHYWEHPYAVTDDNLVEIPLGVKDLLDRLGCGGNLFA